MADKNDVWFLLSPDKKAWMRRIFNDPGLIKTETGIYLGELVYNNIITYNSINIIFRYYLPFHNKSFLTLKRAQKYIDQYLIEYYKIINYEIEFLSEEKFEKLKLLL